MRKWDVKERRTQPERRPAVKKSMPFYVIPMIVALVAVAFSLLPSGILQKLKELALKIPGARTVIFHPLTCSLCKHVSCIWNSAKRMICSNLRAFCRKLHGLPVVRMVSSRLCCLWASTMKWISSTLHIPMGKFQNLAQMSRDRFSSVVEKVNEKKVPIKEKINMRPGMQ